MLMCADLAQARIEAAGAVEARGNQPQTADGASLVPPKSSSRSSLSVFLSSVKDVTTKVPIPNTPYTMPDPSQAVREHMRHISAAQLVQLSLSSSPDPFGGFRRKASRVSVKYLKAHNNFILTSLHVYGPMHAKSFTHQNFHVSKQLAMANHGSIAQKPVHLKRYSLIAYPLRRSACKWIDAQQKRFTCR